MKLVLGNIAILVCFLILIEIVIRIFGSSFGSNPINADPVYHHSHPKDYCYDYYSPFNEFAGHKICYDNDGWVTNIKKRQKHIFLDNSKIIFLGDSFMEGIFVPFDSSIVQRLQNEYPQIEFLNYGVSSYSPTIYYLIAKYKIMPLEPPPEKVFIMLYSNDIRDDKKYLENAVFNEFGDMIAIDGGVSNPCIAFLRKSYLSKYIRRAQIRLKYYMRKEPINNSTSHEVVGKYLEEFPEWKGTISEEYLKHTLQMLDTRGINTYITVVPSKYNHYQQIKRKSEFSEKVKKWAHSNKVCFIDLVEAFNQWKLNNDHSLFYNQDIHFNSEGNKISAETISPYILDERNSFSCDTNKIAPNIPSKTQ